MKDTTDESCSVTWEVLWLNSIVLSWRFPSFGTVLCEHATTAKAFRTVFVALTTPKGQKHSLAALRQRLKNKRSEADVRAVMEEWNEQYREVKPLLPAWLDIRVDTNSEDCWLEKQERWNLTANEVAIVLPSKEGSSAEKVIDFLNKLNGQWVCSFAPNPVVGGNESSLPASEQSQGWLRVWTKVIAKASEDREFRGKLLASNRKTVDAALLLLNQFGYEVPRGVSCSFSERPARSRDADVAEVRVTMHLPPAPKPGEHEQIAIAEYAQLGHQVACCMCCC